MCSSVTKRREKRKSYSNTSGEILLSMYSGNMNASEPLILMVFIFALHLST